MGQTMSERAVAHLLLVGAGCISIPEQFRQAFSAHEHRIEVASSGTAGLEVVRARAPEPLKPLDRNHLRRVEVRP